MVVVLYARPVACRLGGAGEKQWRTTKAESVAEARRSSGRQVTLAPSQGHGVRAKRWVSRRRTTAASSQCQQQPCRSHVESVVVSSR